MTTVIKCLLRGGVVAELKEFENEDDAGHVWECSPLSDYTPPPTKQLLDRTTELLNSQYSLITGAAVPAPVAMLIFTLQQQLGAEIVEALPDVIESGEGVIH